MRGIEQPGPVHPERVQCAAANIRAVDVKLHQGMTLLDGLADVVRSHGVSSAVFSLRGGSFEPLAFYMPALSESPKHVAYFSERFESPGEARIDSGSITFGLRGGEPSLHCHAIWIEPDGRRRSGHLIPAESRVASSVHLEAWMLDGAGFEVMADSETNFNLMQVSAGVVRSGGTQAFVVRLRPNQDLCLALESLCAERGIRRASIRGGVGSLIGTVFEDGRTVEPFVTEVFIRTGEIEPGTDGAPVASVDVGLVAHSGEIAEGRLKRGENPVLITFELVIEPHEWA
ncbi:PCC domain-containing protein (plasmid) [Cupriavidus basilensis]